MITCRPQKWQGHSQAAVVEEGLNAQATESSFQSRMVRGKRGIWKGIVDERSGYRQYE